MPRLRTMKRLGAWVAGMAAAAMVHAGQGRSAHVDFCYSGVSAASAVRIDDECFISTTMPTEWGWQVERGETGRYNLTVGERIIGIEPQRLNGQTMLPMSDIARALDAEIHWRAQTDILDVTSRVRVIRVTNGHLNVSASLPVLPRVTIPPKGDRVVVDMLGASVSLDAIVDVLPGLTVTAPKPGSVRIEFPIQRPIKLGSELGHPTREFDIDTTLTAPVHPSTEAAAEEPIQIEQETDSALSLSMPLPAKLAHAPNFARLDARTLRIWLPGIQVDLSEGSAKSPSIKQVQAEPSPAGTSLTFQLVRPMGVTLSADNGLHLRFVKPPVGDGQLAGKVIVVDAGHGGHDSGTKALSDGLQEKMLTLTVARMLAADLADQGATVIMTRQTDVFIPLEERAGIANRNHANLFLCVHINSNGHDTRTSGSITFYHNADPVSSTLADCIERQLPAASGIPGIGIWSDTKIYDVGFSVLRNTRMPAVLMELGFINNAHDRPRLARKDVQEAMAAAIVKGVKVYLGEPDGNEK